MRIGDMHYRSVALTDDRRGVRVIDQRALPWELKFIELRTLPEFEYAIHDMIVRGAPLIGAVAAHGLAFELMNDASDANFQTAYDRLHATRPTAVNLRWALEQVKNAALAMPIDLRAAAALTRAEEIASEDIALNQSIGRHGADIVRQIYSEILARIAQPKPGKPIQIMTHCNTGWLATVDYGTALGVIYTAHDAGIPLHVWVSETRPRNQGSALTAWELAQHGVPHTVIADNAAGLLMQQSQVDLCIVGADRVARNGDTCNKIGTYLKALAAAAHKIPFYVALPYTTFDMSIATGLDIPIEERAGTEVTTITGRGADGAMQAVTLTPSRAANPAFDITPQHLITGYITERGMISSLHDLATA